MKLLREHFFGKPRGLPPESLDAVLAAHDLWFDYDRVAVLRGVSLKARKGRVLCLMGRNGVGKTTTLENLIGAWQPKRGAVYLNGEDVTHWAPHRRAQAGLNLVPQGRDIFPKLTVEENLLIGCEGNRSAGRRIPESIYEIFPVLKQMRRRLGGDISGGQQQQLAIARSLAGNPKVLLLDEPTEGIQPNIIETIGQVIRKLVAAGLTIILVEQFVSFVREFGDDVLIMDRGRIVQDVSAAKLTEELVQHHLGVGLASSYSGKSSRGP